MRNAQWEMYRPTPGPSRAGFSTLIHYYQGRGKTGNTEHGTGNMNCIIFLYLQLPNNSKFRI